MVFLSTYEMVFLKYITIYLSIHLQMMATEYGNELNQEQFHAFYHKLAERPILREIFNEFAGANSESLSLAEFKAFLVKKQAMNVGDANVIDLINRYEPEQKKKVCGKSK